jgi:cysteine sulfinate desulfinase/cysteine desulfurase-like protein
MERCRETIDAAPSELLSSSGQTGFLQRLPNTLLLEWPHNIGNLAKLAKGLIFATPRAANPADEITRCLQAIGLEQPRVDRCMRLSFGWTTSEEQIDRGVELLAEAWDYCRPT